jgi:hypothetical protein
VKNAKTAVNLMTNITMLYIIFQLLSVMTFTSLSNNIESQHIKLINEPIVLQAIDYENIPDSLAEQFEGAGCSFSKTSKSKSIAITAEHMLVKIGGVIYFLKQAGEKNGNTIYKNERYHCTVKFGKSISQGEGGGTSKATLIIKRLADTKATIITGIMGCGC